MQKVLLNRFWVMAGRWQLMSLESTVERPRIVERAWMRQIYAPYWRGGGVALTVGPYSLRVGTCSPGMEIDESDDSFYWGDLDTHFDEHLEASLFEAGPVDNIDPTIGELTVEPVTALVDTRTNTLVAVVHEGGEVEHIEQKGWSGESLPWPP